MSRPTRDIHLSRISTLTFLILYEFELLCGGNLHSKSFHASSSRKLRLEQKKKGRNFHHFMPFCRCSNFRGITRLETLATQASVEVIVADFSKSSIYSLLPLPLPRHQTVGASHLFSKMRSPLSFCMIQSSSQRASHKAIFGLFRAEHAMISPQ